MLFNSVKPIRKRWAFLVGINNYIDSQYPDLRFCINDVSSLEDLLTKIGYKVTCLNNDKLGQYSPTKNNILAELNTFCSAHPDDLLLIYFACHGIQIKGEPYLIVQDTRHALLEQQSIAIADIEKIIHQSEATRKILLLDACHAGVDMGRDIIDPDFIHNVYDQAEGFALLAASTAQQTAFELENIEHGIFSYFVLEGLRGLADRQSKNFVTVDDLRVYVLHTIRDWGKSQGGLLQEPTDKREGIGDFILADYRNYSRPTVESKLASVFDRKQQLENQTSVETLEISQASQALIQSLKQQRQGIKRQLDAVSDALLGADVSEEIRLEAQRDRFVKKINQIDQKLYELGDGITKS